MSVMMMDEEGGAGAEEGDKTTETGSITGVWCLYGKCLYATTARDAAHVIQDAVTGTGNQVKNGVSYKLRAIFLNRGQG